MTDSESPTVSDVFELLNRWRHLPGYPLEGRSAPFFALFLREILRAHFNGIEMHEVVIPEFPLRQGTLDGGNGSNLSYNVDYVAFAKNRSAAYLVELKTDMESKSKDQERYLQKARGTCFPRLVEGVRELAKRSDTRKKRRKYFHLLHLLSAPGLDLLSICDHSRPDRNEFLCVRGKWRSAVGGLKVDQSGFGDRNVVFIQPVKHEADGCTGFEYIYFKEVAHIVQQHGDIGCMFANYLRQWTEEAGSLDPRSFDRS